MSYRKHQVKAKIRKLKPKKSVFKNKWFWSVVLIVVVLGFVTWLFLFASFLQADNIIISGNKEIKTENIKSIAEKFANKNIFLVNTKNIQKEILNNFPEIKQVEVKKNYFKTLAVRVEERSPVAIFCVTENSASCSFVDGDGIIFKQAETTNDFVIVRSQTMPSDLVLGKQVLDKNILDAILKTQKTLKENYGVVVTTAVIQNETRLNVKTSENWQVYFNIENNNINSQIEKINLLLKNEIQIQDRQKLQYIDLRFKDRVYYK